MKPTTPIALTWRRIACGLWFAFSLITGTITMNPATAAPIFKLKPAGEYFDDPKALALLDAALAGDLKRAQSLVAAGANPQAEGPRQADERIDLLDYAIAAGKPQAIRVLVAVGADPERIHQGPGNAFLFAMTLGKMDLYALLLELKPVKSLSKDTLEYLMFEAVRQSWRTGQVPQMAIAAVASSPRVGYHHQVGFPRHAACCRQGAVRSATSFGRS